jgi:hypothetical protein
VRHLEAVRHYEGVRHPAALRHPAAGLAAVRHPPALLHLQGPQDLPIPRAHDNLLSDLEFGTAGVRRPGKRPVPLLLKELDMPAT